MASHTAPEVSLEDELRELTEIQEREWSVIIKDKYGRNPGEPNNNDEEDVEEEDDIYEVLIDDFFEELEKIPIESKTDYIAALIQVPHLVENESNPTVFLRSANYDPKDAAIGLCEYWKQRVEIFKENAFEPMTLRGACKDIVHPIIDFNLQNLFRILPDDDSGRTVVCYDRTNIKIGEFDEMVIVSFFN